MSDALTRREPGALGRPEIDPAILEQVVASGDLRRLNPEQRTTWYRYRCEAAGLDPRTQPFGYLELQGKLVLYAHKTATDQLIHNHRLTVHLGARTVDQESGLLIQPCRVTRQDGTTVDDVGAVHVGGLKGDALCNAIMKCVTKAKRRTVLSACGLGATDETEIETIPGARVVPVEQAHAQLPAPKPPSYSQRLATAETPEAVQAALQDYLAGLKDDAGRPKRVAAAEQAAAKRLRELTPEPPPDAEAEEVPTPDTWIRRAGQTSTAGDVAQLELEILPLQQHYHPDDWRLIQAALKSAKKRAANTRTAGLTAAEAMEQ